MAKTGEVRETYFALGSVLPFLKTRHWNTGILLKMKMLSSPLIFTSLCDILLLSIGLLHIRYVGVNCWAQKVHVYKKYL